MCQLSRSSQQRPSGVKVSTSQPASVASLPSSRMVVQYSIAAAPPVAVGSPKRTSRSDSVPNASFV
jgi:hypothetical protein